MATARTPSATLVGYRSVDLATGTVADHPSARPGRLLPAHLGVRHRRGGRGHPSAWTPGDPEAGRAAIDEIVRWRRANQPGGANAGSVFTNPPGDSAGRLIEACGLKGLRIGTAEVSPKHANFIQADRGGSADDVRRLIDAVRAEVLAGHRDRSRPPRSAWSASTTGDAARRTR